MATLRQTFSDIASAIRAKGVSGTMKPIEMASKIGEIQTGGGSEDYGYLTFTAEQATTLTLKNYQTSYIHKVLKSSDGVIWVKCVNPATNGISLNAGQSVYLKADEDTLNRTSISDTGYNKFFSTGKIKCNGDVRSIVKLFAPANYSHFLSGLFSDCTSLTNAPELHTTSLPEKCYFVMFSGCTSLTKAPELPATTLTEYCYKEMFSNCTSLTTAPELPATTLDKGCYANMFQNCTSLTTAPELPATELPRATSYDSYCYYNMFYKCTSLKRIKMNASSGSWGTNMFNGCTSLELVDMTGSTGVPTLSNVNNFSNTNDTYKVVVPDSLYDTWIAATNWASISSHIMKQSDWNSEHPDDILG